MTTLLQYAETEFPRHLVELPDGDVGLSDHTVVARVLADEAADIAAQRVRAAMPDQRITVAIVQPTPPTLVPSGGEDRDTPLDLPKRRPAVVGLAGGLVTGLIVGFVVGAAVNAWAGVICGVFAFGLAAAWFAIAGGGSRWAGERAWDQPNRPDATVTLLAAVTGAEADARYAAEVMEQIGITDVRIVDSDGAWHTPNT